MLPIDCRCALRSLAFHPGTPHLQRCGRMLWRFCGGTGYSRAVPPPSHEPGKRGQNEEIASVLFRNRPRGDARGLFVSGTDTAIRSNDHTNQISARLQNRWIEAWMPIDPVPDTESVCGAWFVDSTPRPWFCLGPTMNLPTPSTTGRFVVRVLDSIPGSSDIGPFPHQGGKKKRSRHV